MGTTPTQLLFTSLRVYTNSPNECDQGSGVSITLSGLSVFTTRGQNGGIHLWWDRSRARQEALKLAISFPAFYCLQTHIILLGNSLPDFWFHVLMRGDEGVLDHAHTRVEGDLDIWKRPMCIEHEVNLQGVVLNLQSRFCANPISLRLFTMSFSFLQHLRSKPGSFVILTSLHSWARLGKVTGNLGFFDTIYMCFQTPFLFVIKGWWDRGSFNVFPTESSIQKWKLLMIQY